MSRAARETDGAGYLPNFTGLRRGLPEKTRTALVVAFQQDEKSMKSTTRRSGASSRSSSKTTWRSGRSELPTNGCMRRTRVELRQPVITIKGNPSPYRTFQPYPCQTRQCWL